MNFALLKPALETDPLNLGFAPLLAAGNYPAIADMLNATTGKGCGTITLPTMTNSAFVTAFMPYLLSIEKLTNQARVATYDRLWRAILAIPTIDFTNANVQSFISLAESDGLLTAAEVTALNQRQGSYAEVLCGAGTVASWQMVQEALAE